MTQDQFHTWLSNPKAMDSESIPKLREVIKRYPYFTAAQMMLAKNLRSENHIDQLKQLQLAAVMTPDRKVLHDYLNDKKKPQSKEELTTEEVDSQEVAEVALSEVDEKVEATATLESVEADHEDFKKEIDEVQVEGAEPVETSEHELAEPRFPDELIPEPVIYQLETAELPEPESSVEEDVAEPDALSFSEWLSLTSSNEYGKQRKTPTQKKPDAEKRDTGDLINHFLEQADSVPKKKVEFFNPRKVAAKGDQGDFTVVSETLANIYFQQEKYELSKQAYEALKLKYPEKSVYFAARLKEIQDKLTSE